MARTAQAHEVLPIECEAGVFTPLANVVNLNHRLDPPACLAVLAQRVSLDVRLPQLPPRRRRQERVTLSLAVIRAAARLVASLAATADQLPAAGVASGWC